MNSPSAEFPRILSNRVHDRIKFSFPTVILCCSLLVLTSVGQAQTPPPPITPSGLNTNINLSATPPAGKIQYDITGGTRPGGRTNLFHSFGNFNVPNNNIANFFNDSGLATSNILARVTGTNGNNPTLSNIFGTIQTIGFGNANLFLMNPAGFLFGPNATVNVGGMVAFTSADYLKLTDNARFNAIPNAAADALLTALPVAAFGFLGSNPEAITVQGSQFAVTQGTGISLVGGNITIQSGTLDNGTVRSARLSAPGGQINLASVASPGEVLASNLQLQANVNGESFTSLGSISIGQDARIDTAGATSGTVVIRGGQLLVADGATIASAASPIPSVPAGSVTINGTGVQMTGSDVVINGTNISVTGSKVTAANLDGSGGTITVTAGSADHPGNVTVAQNALLDASGTSGGSIAIRGKQLVVNNATISADTGDADGAPVAIDINVTGAVSLTSTNLSALTARTSGAGNAGDIVITSGSLNATFATDSLFVPLIDSHTTGSGRTDSFHGGNVTITTGPLTVNADPFAPGDFIISGTGGDGKGGNVTITAGDAQFTNPGIDTGMNVFEGGGSGGNLTVTANSLILNNVSWGTDSFARAGAISLESSGLLSVTHSFMGSTSLLGQNPVTVKADKFVLNNTPFLTGTALGDGEDFNVTARVVELSNGGVIGTQTFGDGSAGNVHIIASERVSLLNSPTDFRPSGIVTSSVGDPDFGTHGNAGSITIDTPRLELTNGARINSTTFTPGQGGDVTILHANSISITGERTLPIQEEFFQGGTRASGIYTKSLGSDLCLGDCGNAGNINITTGSLMLQNGGVIDSGTTNNGLGGNITINATGPMLLSGTMVDGTPGGIFSQATGTDPDAGDGGSILLNANSVTIQNGSSISASSTGAANAGNIHITATNGLSMQNSSITTQATPSGTGSSAGGGNIEITTSDSATVYMNNSLISASVADGPGGGGNIKIDPQFVILQNSQILAQAAQGQGGTITIIAGLFLPDANSVVNADSGTGVNGTVTIQSPNAPASGKIQPLGKSPLQATSLLNQHCASLAGGEFSSFTVAGRDSLPTEPGGWLSSPLALAISESGSGTLTETGTRASLSEPVGYTPFLSLRQIAPAGFLTQAFAVESSAGCQS